MSAARNHRGPHGSIEQQEQLQASRLHLLAAVGDEAGDAEVLLAALQQVTAELRGLGAMAHLRMGGARGDLGLVAASGLPEVFTRAWKRVRANGPHAPARAFLSGEAVWLPAEAVRELPLPSASNALVTSDAPVDFGIAAVTLPGPDGPLGTLSVLTPPHDEPAPSRWAFCRDVAWWTARRLRLLYPAANNVSRALFQAPGPGQEVREALLAAAAGTWTWDLRTGEARLSDSLLEAVGADPKQYDSRAETWIGWIHPDDVASVVAEIDKSLRSHSTRIDFEYRLRRADNTYGWVRSRGRVVLGEDGEPAQIIGATWNSTETHAALEPVGRALRHMNDGFISVDSDWKIGFVNVAAERLLGASLNQPDQLLWDLPAMRNLPVLAERCHQAVADGEPTGFDLQWPESERWFHIRLVPALGGLTLYITDITEKHLREVAEQDAAERAVLMGRLTEVLAQAVTVQDVVTAVADSVLPAFHATGLVFGALENDHLRLVHAVGYPPALLSQAPASPVSAATPIGVALRTRAPRFVQSPEELAACCPETAGFWITGGKQAWAFLPLVVSGRAVGCAVVAFDQQPHLSREEQTLLTALSGLIAQAFERASLYDAATTQARELQRVLLPHALPTLPAVTTAARYMSAEHGSEIGGDWYDVIPLSADRVALVIGDVMGHGITEAATMGRLRTAVRTLSDLELPPDEVLEHLNEVITDLDDDSYATCSYGVYDPITGEFTYTSAGHPPPAIARPDGTVAFCPPAANPPLGAATPPFDTTTIHLPDGSLLVFYTDGLVESRDRDIDDGMACLARIMSTAPHADRSRRHLERLCDSITTTLLPTRNPASDDAALLVARTCLLPRENVATWQLPEAPIAAGQARNHTRHQLATWHLDDLEMTTELLVSELVGNVIRHAKGPIALRLIRSSSLICEVSDGSLTTPHIRRTSAMDEGGRGLQLVAALAHRWGTRHTPAGKSIWTEQVLPPRGDPRSAGPVADMMVPSRAQLSVP